MSPSGPPPGVGKPYTVVTILLVDYRKGTLCSYRYNFLKGRDPYLKKVTVVTWSGLVHMRTKKYSGMKHHLVCFVFSCIEFLVSFFKMNRMSFQVWSDCRLLFYSNLSL